MNIIACGEGFGVYNIERICLERDVTLLGFLEGSCEGRSRRGTEVISIGDINKYEFAYVVICNPACGRYELPLEQEIGEQKILSLVKDTDGTLKKLGRVRNIVYRKKGTRDDYIVLALNGKFVGQVPPILNEESQYGLVERLLKMYMRIREDEAKFGRKFSAGANWANFLASSRKEFYDAVAKKDVLKVTALLNNCCRNNMTAGIGQGEFYKAYCDSPDEGLAVSIMKYFKIWAHSIKADMPIDDVRLPEIGNPYGYLIGDSLVYENAFINHYRAKYCGDLVSDRQSPVVVEIGAGLGLFPYYLVKQYPHVTYVDFDLPEILIVTAYLLSIAFPHKRILLYNDRNAAISKELLAEYDIILMPAFMITTLEDLSADLVINTISLGEMSMANINVYMGQITRVCKKYFYSENLADFCYDYENYPEDCFRVPDSFKLLMRAPSRWPFFSFESKQHINTEDLYERR